MEVLYVSLHICWKQGISYRKDALGRIEIHIMFTSPAMEGEKYRVISFIVIGPNCSRNRPGERSQPWRE